MYIIKYRRKFTEYRIKTSQKYTKDRVSGLTLVLSYLFSESTLWYRKRDLEYENMFRQGIRQGDLGKPVILLQLFAKAEIFIKICTNFSISDDNRNRKRI